MSKHTPGPWEAGINPAAWQGASNRIVVRPAGEFPHGLWVADVGREDSEAEANARLIAAAPDMLEALRWAATQVGYKQRLKQNADHCDKVDALRAAIAKAEGES